jgi:hypothetical protein
MADQWDEHLEARIDAAYMRYAALGQQMRQQPRGSRRRREISERVRAAWAEVESLVRQRSPRQVARMEQAQGLR